MSIVDFWSEAKFDQPPFVHPADCAMLDRARPKLASGGYLHLALIPEPYSGDLQNADIFILNANPGYGGTEYAEQYGNPEFRARLISSVQQDFEGVEYPHVYFDPLYQNFAGYTWWARHLRGIGSDDVLARRVATLDLFPYHSKGFQHNSVVAQLPSALAIKRFVHRDLLPRAKKGEILLIVCRQTRNWGFMDEDDDGNNVIIYPRSQAQAASIRATTPAGRAIKARLLGKSYRSKPLKKNIRVNPDGKNTAVGSAFPYIEDPTDSAKNDPGQIIGGSAPCEISVDSKYFRLNKDWQRENLSSKQLDLLAIRLIGLRGEEAVLKIVRFVEAHGPIIGSEIVRKALGREPGGNGQSLVKLFRFACRHHGVLFYKQGNYRSGESRYCTLNQAFRHRAQ